LTPLSKRLAVLLIVLSGMPLRAIQKAGQAVSGLVVQGAIQVGPYSSQPGANPAGTPAAGPVVGVAADPSSAVTLEGSVVNALTGEPVRQANLTIRLLSVGPPVSMNPGPPRVFSATSNASGNFEFENLPPGSYILDADKSGYVRQQYSPGAEAQRGPHPLVGSPGGAIKDIEFKLMPQGIISGSVLDENGEPVMGASIQVLKLMSYFHETQSVGGGNSNAVGEFLIGGLLPGKYLVRAENRSGAFSMAPAPAVTGGGARESYVPTFYPSATKIEAAAPVPIAAGQRVDAIEIRLQRDRVYAVRGRVTGMADPAAGLPHVGIYLGPQTPAGALGPRPLGQTNLSRDGTFEIGSVQPGSYYLTATRYGDKGPPQGMVVVPVTVANSDVEGIVISMTDSQPMEMEVSGTVKIEGQENGRFSSSVLLQSALGPFWASFIEPARVQNDGTFRFENVPSGKYIVNLSDMPSGGFVKEIRAGASDILVSGLDLTQPQSPLPLEILIGRNAATITGIVRDGDQPQPRAYITLLPEPFRPEARQLQKSTISDATGLFTLDGVSPGRYRLYAWREPVQADLLQPDDLKPYEAESVTVTVDEGEQKRIELKLIQPQ
jgi:Carboxypeptidase regulatory-like domain